MEKILFLIAVCEVVRALQNGVQLAMMLHDTAGRDNAYAEFVKSLKASDREYIEHLLRECEKIDAEVEDLKEQEHD